MVSLGQQSCIKGTIVATVIFLFGFVYRTASLAGYTLNLTRNDITFSANLTQTNANQSDSNNPEFFPPATLIGSYTQSVSLAATASSSSTASQTQTRSMNLTSTPTGTSVTQSSSQTLTASSTSTATKNVNLSLTENISGDSNRSDHGTLPCDPPVVAAADGLIDGYYTANHNWIPFSEALRSVNDSAVVEPYDLLIFGDSLDRYYIQDTCRLLPGGIYFYDAVKFSAEMATCISSWGNVSW